MQDVVVVLAPFPYFIDGDTHPTIPFKFKDSRLLGTASADTQKDRGNGSRIYEVNLWLWRYGRSQPRTMSIEEAEAVRRDRVSEARSRAVRGEKETQQGGGSQRARSAGVMKQYFIMSHKISHMKSHMISQTMIS
jgi:hypothetical protein